jgi:hypothetical protein
VVVSGVVADDSGVVRLRIGEWWEAGLGGAAVRLRAYACG